MAPGSTVRRVSYIFLCIVPFLIIPLAGARPLRIPGFHQSAGAVLFALIAVSVWLLAKDRGATGAEPEPRLSAGGALLVLPFALVALLWVGLGTPWDATPPENVMRYAVLLAGSIAVTVGFTLLREVLRDSGERLYSTLGAGGNVLAGAAYVVWLSFQLGASAARMNLGRLPDSVVAVGNIFDTLLFAACALTYLTTAAFAHAMGRLGWLRRTPARIFVVLNLIALFFLCLRGLSFPDPTQSATPWYLRPGFVAGIPAIPWIMPFLLGAVSLRTPLRRDRY